MKSTLGIFNHPCPLISPAEYVTLLAGTVVSLGQVVAVLGAVTVVMAVSTFVLLWTVEE